MKLRCLVVDDESLARKFLEDYIGQIPFLEHVGSCKNAFDALETLQREAVDLMFLDIQMPGMLGTKFLASLRERPMVVFVTAYSNYALESYDLDVVDYLMKPVSLERFTKAALKALEMKQLRQATANATPELPAPQQDFFFVNVEYALVKIPVADVTHIEGMKDYVKIYLRTAPKPVLTKSTLKGIEEKLPPGKFLRVHKSFIVSVEKVESIRNHQVTIGSFEIPVNEASAEELLRMLGMKR